ncbi:hypothetical protein GAYE_SCF06G2780 [Galdieria yellowstonensis]|uniref:Uncharacterized protein n=1 Tax=Galdieria yellowstonensis TaxID=3028027 RepID=A0AAV9IC79_9RHOD|nr:hypothetical protein GAYE_SCF06G2780 [Galdieria yellowstonensis]
MLSVTGAKVAPFQSEVFTPFELVLALENRMETTVIDLVVRYVVDCSQEVAPRNIFELEGFTLQKGLQNIVCENISLCFLKEFHEWEYCNVGYLEVLLFSEGKKQLLVSLNLVVQIFTDREYAGALKRVYSLVHTQNNHGIIS